MLVLTHGRIRSRWRMGPMALLLLIAWAPTLLYLDHWPTPALLQGADGASEMAFHAHGPTGESYVGLVPVAEGDPSVVNHAEHGHGANSAQGAATPALVVPDGVYVAPVLMSWVLAPVVSGSIDGESHAPPSPPPR